jgi:hypothetical protein
MATTERANVVKAALGRPKQQQRNSEERSPSQFGGRSRPGSLLPALAPDAFLPQELSQAGHSICITSRDAKIFGRASHSWRYIPAAIAPDGSTRVGLPTKPSQGSGLTYCRINS